MTREDQPAGTSESHLRDVAPDFGQRFEAANGEADVARWRVASDAEFGRAIAELMRHAERVALATGIRNDEPAKRFPSRRRGEAHDA